MNDSLKIEILKQRPTPGGAAIRYAPEMIVRLDRKPDVRFKLAMLKAKQTKRMPLILESKPTPFVQAETSTKYDARYYMRKWIQVVEKEENKVPFCG
jgi:hypothetical protein